MTVWAGAAGPELVGSEVPCLGRFLDPFGRPLFFVPGVPVALESGLRPLPGAAPDGAVTWDGEGWRPALSAAFPGDALPGSWSWSSTRIGSGAAAVRVEDKGRGFLVPLSLRTFELLLPLGRPRALLPADGSGAPQPERPATDDSGGRCKGGPMAPGLSTGG